MVPVCFLEQFCILAKCNTKFDCLVKEKPTLNMQTDSISAKVCAWNFFNFFFCFLGSFVLILIFQASLTDIVYTMHNFYDKDKNKRKNPFTCVHTRYERT